MYMVLFVETCSEHSLAVETNTWVWALLLQFQRRRHGYESAIPRQMVVC